VKKKTVLKKMLVFRDGVFDAQFQPPGLAGGKIIEEYALSFAPTSAITASNITY
jgi:hypothetical protein